MLRDCVHSPDVKKNIPISHSRLITITHAIHIYNILLWHVLSFHFLMCIRGMCLCICMFLCGGMHGHLYIWRHVKPQRRSLMSLPPHFLRQSTSIKPRALTHLASLALRVPVTTFQSWNHRWAATSIQHFHGILTLEQQALSHLPAPVWFFHSDKA